jgi:hypothetical protein
MTSPSWNRVSQARENLASDPWFAKRRRLGIERNGQHATADIPADGLRIQQLRSGDSDADTYVFGKMNIRHHRDVPYIRRAAQTLDSFGHLIL